MPITSIESIPESLTLTVVGDYPVSVDRLWGAWADPRQLERFWGPPEWPATFTRHEMRVGGRSQYYMTGPEGQTSHGYWEFVLVEPPRRFEVVDGFARADGTPDEELPTCRMSMRFSATASGARFEGVTVFPSVEAMERMLEMGMLEGLRAAMGQLDEVLADLREYSAAGMSELELLDDRRARVTRVVRGSVEQVWRAHHEPALLQRWLLGPDGWTMPVCEVAREVGETYRYEWENSADGTRFGFTGELRESEAPRRAVTTERLLGTDGPSNVDELELEALPGNRTLIRVTITFPTEELRDMILGTGMVDGMESSYARLEALLNG
jgi:uncharacterized protein YndB with AHSA1/START domain